MSAAAEMDLHPPGEPVFVLCGGRSGSTLLRFLLDSHPDLACPPETNLPGMAGQLATVWSLIAGAPLSQERDDEPPVIPDEAILGVRATLDTMTGSYLARRGKKRYCDKSLGTARYAELLLRIYPGAKFLCVYRHPMDVIASGLEACPWGLRGYGFDAYIAATPGNAVWALARFWVDTVLAILAAEERFGESCHRVRYEDMVADPEGVADEIFRFLGVPPAPGVSARCFAPERERFGPADYKIWHTTKVNGESVGRGWPVPAGMIPPQVTQQINELAEKLGYVPVDEAWGTAAVPPDMRAVRSVDPVPGPRPPLPRATPVGDHLRAALSQVDQQFTSRWGLCTTESFTVAALPVAGSGAGEPAQWRVDLATGSLTQLARADDDETSWDIVGSTDAWLAVLDGRTNLGVAIRRCELRYCDANEAGPVAADTRIAMLSDLISLGSARRRDAPVGEEPSFEPAS